MVGLSKRVRQGEASFPLSSPYFDLRDCLFTTHELILTVFSVTPLKANFVTALGAAGTRELEL